MKDINNYIPTVNQMYEIYKQEKRIYYQNLNSNKDIYNEENLFYKKFRKYNNENVELYLEQTENIYYKEYKKYFENAQKESKQIITDIENLINYERFFLKLERKLAIKTNKQKSNAYTRYRSDNIKELENKLKTLINNSKENFIFYYHRQIKKDISNQNQGKLVNTLYVKDTKKKILDAFEKGIPVYLVGHLGSGKTQIANEICTEYLINKKIQSEIENHLVLWVDRNKMANEEDLINEFKKIYDKRIYHYDNLLKDGLNEEIEEITPLFISGSYNLTYEDMFIEKTLYLEHSFSKGSFSDYLDMIINDFYQWMEDHKEQLDRMTNEEQLNLKIQIWKSFSDLLVAKNSAFGTEIKKIEKEILIAVRQGKPVIIDELNTIAMENLIGLNDILQKYVGSKAYITGVGLVEIKDGFALIGTGNLSTEMVTYEGTNKLNPAFKSRFITIEYNYPPQNIIGELLNQTDNMQNELFRIIISRLIDDLGNLTLPNIENAIEELFNLSQLAKLTQNVFMGKWQDNSEDYEEELVEVNLKESVLSIRNIFHVLDNWNLGEEKDLSMALWDGFIGSITNPDDQSYILSQAVKFGFFKKEDGWNVKTKQIGQSMTSLNEILIKKYTYKRYNMETYSYLDIIELLFGPIPEEKYLPDELVKIFGKETKKLNIDIELYEQLNKELLKLEHSINLMEYIEEKSDKNEE